MWNAKGDDVSLQRLSKVRARRTPRPGVLRGVEPAVGRIGDCQAAEHAGVYTAAKRPARTAQEVMDALVIMQGELAVQNTADIEELQRQMQAAVDKDKDGGTFVSAEDVSAFKLKVRWRRARAF